MSIVYMYILHQSIIIGLFLPRPCQFVFEFEFPLVFIRLSVLMFDIYICSCIHLTCFCLVKDYKLLIPYNVLILFILFKIIWKTYVYFFANSFSHIISIAPSTYICELQAVIKHRIVVERRMLKK